MKIDFKNNIENENPTLNEAPPGDTKIQEFLVNHAGEKLSPEGDNVTIEMIIEVMSEEFPELVLALAEENFIRGYAQAFSDIEATSSALHKEKPLSE